MSELYRVPKLKIRVEIRMASGLEEKGFLFLGERAEEHGGPERALDLLNGDNEFLVIENDGGQVSFVARGSVSLVTIAAADSISDPAAGGNPLDADLDIEAPIEVLLEDGTSVTGATRYQLPEERCRVQDFLNAPDHFLPVFHETGVSFVNKRRIARVTPG